MSAVGRFLEAGVVERLKGLSLSARSVVEGGTVGRHRSLLLGASVEFRQHRIYVAGDEPRRLDWRVLGRTDRTYVREYEEETNLRGMILVDGSGSMGYGGRDGGTEARRHEGMSKFEYACRVVAGLAYLMLGASESVGVGVFGEGEGRWVPARGGAMQLARVVDALERTAVGGKTEIASAMHAAAERMERRGLVVVISDFFGDLGTIKAGLAHLRHDRHEVIALQVVDRDEVEFPLRKWVRLKGLEDEGARVVEPAMVRQGYLTRFEGHTRELEEGCRGLGVEFYRMVTDVEVGEGIVRFLARRGGGAK